MSTLFTHFFTKINEISPLEHDFTEVLSTIALMPKTLYFRGKLPENVVENGQKGGAKSGQNTTKSINNAKNSGNQPTHPKTVAIVGSRHNTKYGEEVAYHLAYELGKRGVVVVSGLAYGIDSIGHQGCLDAGGRTVAVLGTRIDDIYPRPHLPLARQIVEKNGAIISEYAPLSRPDAPLAPGEGGFDGKKWISYEKQIEDGISSSCFSRRRIDQKITFLYRNRLIAGLSDIVVVVEAAERSGSLNTATHALEQGKEVFAVPGNITSPYSQGCNKLIAQGATPYTEPDDILRLLFPEDFAKKRKNTAGASLVGSNDVETAILTALAGGLRSGEDIMKAKNLPPEVFNQVITLLEIRGAVRALSANNWMLN